MGFNINGTPRQKLVRAAALAIAASAVGLLVADAAVRDKAALYAGLTLLSLSVTVYFLGVIRISPKPEDPWNGVAWGQLVAGTVHASVTAIFLWVLLRTPEVRHLAGRLRF
jgi:uncharacterized membrane protein